MVSLIKKLNKKYLFYIEKNKINILGSDKGNFYPAFGFVCLGETDTQYVVATGINDDQFAGVTTLSFKSNTGNCMDFIRVDFDSRLIAKNKKEAIIKYLTFAHPVQSKIINEDLIYETLEANEKKYNLINDLVNPFSSFLDVKYGQSALDAVWTVNPSLTAWGFDEQQEQSFQTNRTELKNSLSQFQCACVYLSRRKKNKMKYSFNNSYTLKHLAEGKFHTYISNGVLIAAALHLGFKYTRIDPNAFFYMSKTEYYGL